MIWRVKPSVRCTVCSASGKAGPHKWRRWAEVLGPLQLSSEKHSSIHQCSMTLCCFPKNSWSDPVKFPGNTKLYLCLHQIFRAVNTDFPQPLGTVEEWEPLRCLHSLSVEFCKHLVWRMHCKKEAPVLRGPNASVSIEELKEFIHFWDVLSILQYWTNSFLCIPSPLVLQ